MSKKLFKRPKSALLISYVGSACANVAYVSGFDAGGNPEFDEAPSEACALRSRRSAVRLLGDAAAHGPPGEYSIVANVRTAAEETLMEETKEEDQ